jgi:hypothetical protein
VVPVEPSPHNVQSPAGPSAAPARTACAELTDEQPFGSIDAKVACAADIVGMNLRARYGRADGAPFDADEFLRRHPRWNWQKGYLKSRPQQPWVYFATANTD